MSEEFFRCEICDRTYRNAELTKCNLCGCYYCPKCMGIDEICIRHFEEVDHEE